jgi:hypothetical protein
MPPEHLHQYTPIVCGQGITVESLDQRLAFLAAEFDLFWSLHH